MKIKGSEIKDEGTKIIQTIFIGEKKPKFSFTEKLKDKQLLGITQTAGKAGDKIQVVRRAFYTDYDGDFFFSCLDGISRVFLNKWLTKNKKSPSEISNCLIFLDRNSVAKFFINCPIRMEILLKGNPISQGRIYKNDIADIRKLEFPGVHFPEKCAIIFIFSDDWRRGLYFDFFPLDEKYENSGENLNELFARFYVQLHFPEIFRQTPELKQKMYEKGWFPFIRLLGSHYTDLFNLMKNDLPIIEFEDQMVDSYDPMIENIVNSWMKNQNFKDREIFIWKGIQEYLEKDYISSISILYPQIEGLIRGLPIPDIDLKGVPMGEKLTDKIVQTTNQYNPDSSLFISEKFKDFLINSYFSKFDPNNGPADLSRHSLAHGMATYEKDYSKITAFQTILILDQLSFYVMSSPKIIEE